MTAPRHHGLDWLRAAAALAVIGLHAGIAYTLHPFPGLAWPVHDSRPSPIVDALTWWIDAWIMPLFFIMSGLLAAQLFERLGPTGFLKHRTRRLLLPLAFACVVILPLDLYVWLLGWVVEERIPLKKLRSLKLGDAGRDLWGVAHLWFLQYLLVFCVGAWVVHRVMARCGRLRLSAKKLFQHREGEAPAEPNENRHPILQRLRRSVALQRRRLRSSEAASRRWLVTGSIACSAAALWWDPQLVIGFRHAWHPLPANLLYYAPCFAAGWWMLHHRSADRRATPVAILGLLASPLLFAAALPLIHAHATAALHGPARGMLAGLFAACGWTAALAAVRLSLIPCPPPPQGVRYLAQASFWLYLFHHPAVGLAQVALHGSGLPAGVKFTVVWIGATSLSLLTYEVCVRRTWIGALLNGGRDPDAGASESRLRAAAPEAVPGRSAA